jgi:DHA2 family multidrug resistance protein
VAAESIDDLFARYGPTYRWLVTFTCIIGAMTGGLASTTVNVAFPDIMGAFGLGRDQAQLLSTGYFASQTIGMLLSAWLIRAGGERLSSNIALGVFLVGCAMSGLAQDAATLMLGRVLQGTASGVLQPMAMAIVFSVFPVGRKGLSMGIFSMGMVMAPTLGPAMGGLAIEYFNWRYVFLLALPTAFLALILGNIFMPSRKIPKVWPKFDFVSFGLLCVCLVGLLLGFSYGQRLGWSSDEIILLFLFGTGAGGYFIYRQLNRVDPLVNLHLFSNAQFTAATMIAFFTECAFLASTVMLPLFVQQIQQYTPFAAGMMMVPAGISMLILFPISGRLADILPPQILVFSGLLFYAASFALMASMDINTPFWTLVAFTLVMRLGSAFTRPVTNSTALSSLPLHQVHQGSSTLNFTRKLGGALGANAVIVFLEMRIPFHGDAFVAAQTGVNQTSLEFREALIRLFAEAGVPRFAQEPGALQVLSEVILAHASTLGFQDAFAILAIIAFTAIVPALIMAHMMRGRVAARF